MLLNKDFKSMYKTPKERRPRWPMMKNLSVFCLAFLLFSEFGHAAPPLTDREDVGKFIRKMTSEHGFDREQLTSVFQKISLKDSIIRAITRPAESKPWHAYRKIFITNNRINQGVDFWHSNAEILAEVEKQYGVPAEIVVAIIGVETGYGRNTGSYRVADALSTLAFEYPKRSSFFSRELEHFLVLCREEKIDPLIPVGSYAGAMGIPQFMPSSYRSYAVDQDQDGRRDIWKNNRDAIGSVSNYFKKHRWIPSTPIAFPARPEGEEFRELLSSGLKPDTTISQIKDAGIKIPTEIESDQQAKVLELESSQGLVYWITLTNFYVITRYNHSALYAMAVYQLSQEIVNRRNDKT